jgi:ribosome-associated toxin RatA of RatAB toxin-antitoxin module
MSILAELLRFFPALPPSRRCVGALAVYPVARSHPEMQTGNSILIQAPRDTIFETAADLEQWPRILPHYRYIRYLERGAERNLVEMAALRSGIQVSWISEQEIDREKMQVRFHHLKAFTRGMRVIWTFSETPAGVLVEIAHVLRFRIPALAPIAEPIIGNFFIHHIANLTLRGMKAHLEGRAQSLSTSAQPNQQRSFAR